RYRHHLEGCNDPRVHLQIVRPADRGPRQLNSLGVPEGRGVAADDQQSLPDVRGSRSSALSDRRSSVRASALGRAALTGGIALEWAISINLRKIRMSDTSQIALIRKLYDAMGDVNSFKSLLADDVEWDIAEGFPNGGVYRGINRVVSDFFTFLADFEEFYAKGDEYFE